MSAVDVTGDDLRDLAADLDAAALQAGQDVEAAAARAATAAERADAAGHEGLLQRARLVLADAAGRQGQTALLGLMAREALAWGSAHDDAFVTARAHRLLSTFHDVLGDGGTSLEHAVAAVELLPADAPAFARGDHESGLAIAHLQLGSYGAARERFHVLLQRADDEGDEALRVRTLNNLAHLEHEAGNQEESVRLAGELVAASERAGITLSAAAWDTVARAQMSSGDPAGAERTLLGALSRTRSITESRDLAELHVTLAQCQRALGRFDDARRSLDVADAECDARDLGPSRALVLEERAALAAATGDHRTAYELHREFHALRIDQLSSAKDARARILATVFETEEAVRSSRRYREMAERDPLTGLHNRRHVERRVPRLLAEAAAARAPLSVAIIDLDHFKQVNDTWSHQVGDAVLVEVSRLLEAACPPGGVTARLGGEEFLLVLPGQDAAAARRSCEDLLGALRAHDWTPVVGALPVTASAGTATAPTGAAVLEDLLREADRQLYGAKRAGRDRVVDATTPVASLLR